MQWLWEPIELVEFRPEILHTHFAEECKIILKMRMALDMLGKFKFLEIPAIDMERNTSFSFDVRLYLFNSNVDKYRGISINLEDVSDIGVSSASVVLKSKMLNIHALTAA